MNNHRFFYKITLPFTIILFISQAIIIFAEEQLREQLS